MNWYNQTLLKREIHFLVRLSVLAHKIVIISNIVDLVLESLDDRHIQPKDQK
jgi:hypothetical protein